MAGEEKIGAVLGELRDPSSILENKDLGALIDFSQPIGLLMTGVLHFLPDRDDPWGLLRRYLNAIAARQLPVALAPDRREQAPGERRAVPRGVRQRHRAPVLP